MNKVRDILKTFKARTLILVSFWLGLIIGIAFMYWIMTLTKESFSFINTDKILLVEEERSFRLGKERLFEGINFEKRLSECKLKLEKEYSTRILILESDLKELQDLGQQMYTCIIGNHVNVKKAE